MLWIKTLGVALVIGSSGIYGMMGAKRMEKRVSELKNMRLAMNFLEKEITCMHTPLTRALMRTAQFCIPPVNVLFRETSLHLHGKLGLTASEAWSRGLDRLREESALAKDDLELLSTAAMQIGMSNVDEQKKLFTLIQEELRIQEEKSLTEAESGQKIWAYGGFILGTMIVLLLI